jgi:diacylglycerol kinase (ATP)
MSYAFIVNPSANRKRAQSSFYWLNTRIAKYWPDSEIFTTESKADIGRAVNEAAKRHDVIIACGGDGTVNEVFSRAIDLDVTLGVLPMGSGNDFAKSIHFSTKSMHAIEQLRDVMPEYIDVVRYRTNLGEGYMFNTLGIGLDGAINHIASKVTKLKGPMIYVYSALKSLFSIRSSTFNMIIDGKESVDELIMLTVANGKVEGGNFIVAPNARNNDNQLELLTIPPLPIYKLLPLLPLFLLGKQFLFSQVAIKNIKSIEMTLHPGQPLHVDGEQMGLNITELQIELLPAKIRVLKPADLTD